jgi:hypothetical protein
MKKTNLFQLVAWFLGGVGVMGCSASADDGASTDGAGEDALSRSSDLAHDLAQPGGVRGTPFRGQHEVALPAAVAASLKSLAGRCIEFHKTTNPREEEIGKPTANICPSEVKNIRDDDAKDTERADLLLGGQWFTAVTWDHEDSDGGDMSDVAFYNPQGKRVGLFRMVMTNSTILDIVAGVSNATIRTVADPYVAESQMDRDMMATGTTPIGAGDVRAPGADIAARLKDMAESCIEKHVSASTGAAKGVFLNRALCMSLPKTRGNMTWSYFMVPVPAHPGSNPDFVDVVAWNTGSQMDLGLYQGVARTAAFTGVPETDFYRSFASAVGATVRVVNAP